MSREGGMEFEDKIVLYGSREVKCKQRFTAIILHYLYKGSREQERFKIIWRGPRNGRTLLTSNKLLKVVRLGRI